MECGSFDGGDDSEYSGSGLLGISKLVAMQDAFFFGSESFDRVK